MVGTHSLTGVLLSRFVLEVSWGTVAKGNVGVDVIATVANLQVMGTEGRGHQVIADCIVRWRSCGVTTN